MREKPQKDRGQQSQVDSLAGPVAVIAARYRLTEHHLSSGLDSLGRMTKAGELLAGSRQEPSATCADHVAAALQRL
jgi:hypothetical protein